MCTVKGGITYTQSETEEFEKSWEYSVKNITRLFQTIAQLPPHDTENTLSINNARKIIQELGWPLARLTNAANTNLESLKENLATLRQLKNEEKDLNTQPRLKKQVSCY